MSSASEASLLEPLHDPALALALTSAPPATRAIFLATFAFDEEMERAASQRGEAILSQIRLAWWRDQLRASGGLRTGVPLLRLVQREFEGEFDSLIALVDGWEATIDPDGGGVASFEPLITARGEVFAAVTRLIGVAQWQGDAARAGRLWGWALAKKRTGANMNAEEPSKDDIRPVRLPGTLRPFTVIGGLARRSLLRGGGDPLLGDRLSPLAAIRLGIFGR